MKDKDLMISTELQRKLMNAEKKTFKAQSKYKKMER